MRADYLVWCFLFSWILADLLVRRILLSWMRALFLVRSILLSWIRVVFVALSDLLLKRASSILIPNLIVGISKFPSFTHQKFSDIFPSSCSSQWSILGKNQSFIGLKSFCFSQIIWALTYTLWFLMESYAKTRLDTWLMIEPWWRQIAVGVVLLIKL